MGVFLRFSLHLSPLQHPYILVYELITDIQGNPHNGV
ncbi:hypothetical protein VPHD528_0016 [Vibrio phage D528]